MMLLLCSECYRSQAVKKWINSKARKALLTGTFLLFVVLLPALLQEVDCVKNEARVITVLVARLGHGFCV